MDWESIVQTWGVTGLGMAVIAWLVRSIVMAVITQDLERFKILHTKRAELLAELYGKLFLLRGAIVRILGEIKDREVREQVDREMPGGNRQPWELRAGLERLSTEEEAAVKSLSESARGFYDFFALNRIFFPVATCEVIDRFCQLSFFLSGNYRNVTFKDPEGRLYVNAQVKEAWDAAVTQIPGLLQRIEDEFRSTLNSAR